MIRCWFTRMGPGTGLEWDQIKSFKKFDSTCFIMGALLVVLVTLHAPSACGQ